MTRTDTASPDMRQCCVRSALDIDAAFCDECGRPLIRCMANAECGGLLDANGMCPVCVNLELSLDAGAASTVREGGRLALPLVIRNASKVGRPVFIQGLWIKEDDGELREIKLPFQRLDPQSSANAGVRTSTLDYAGVHQVDLLIAASTRYQWREEQYVFASYILFPVESRTPGGPSTTINVNADAVGAGFTVYNPTRIEAERAAGAAASAAPLPLKMIHADLAERDLKLRGYDSNVQVPRRVELNWRGFQKGTAPFDGPIVKPSGLLLAGRNSVGAGNDLCLRVDDDALTVTISRLLFSLYTESGRFMLRVDGQYGLRINDQSHERTETVALNHGDVIQPLRKHPEALGISVSFETEHGTVKRIVLTRVPAAEGDPQ